MVSVHIADLLCGPVPSSAGSPGGWHLFNDFLVKEVSEDEALSFSGTWKVRNSFTLLGNADVAS